MQGELGIMQQPKMIRSFKKKDALFTLDELDRLMPELLDAKRSHDERGEKEGTAEPV